MRQHKSATGWQYAELYNRAMLADGKALPDGTTLTFPQDMIDRMKDQNIFAHVNLLKGERSELSELASNLL